ncbi:hypothetical protein K4O61_01705 [Staphylococcus epidermidis]|nr:hypothetical protein [Staphylococcus epidermidis]
MVAKFYDAYGNYLGKINGIKDYLNIKKYFDEEIKDEIQRKLENYKREKKVLLLTDGDKLNAEQISKVELKNFTLDKVVELKIN